METHPMARVIMGCYYQLCPGLCRSPLPTGDYWGRIAGMCHWVSYRPGVPQRSARSNACQKRGMSSFAMIVILFASAFASGVAVFFLKRDNTNLLTLVLSFSGAYLFSIAVLHLIPEVYHTHSAHAH